MVAKHFSEGKPDIAQVPPEVILEIAKAFGYGAGKYGKNNWLAGMEWTELYSSAMRHLLEWRNNIDFDPESSLPHLSHALTNLTMLTVYSQRSLGTDDRVCSEQVTSNPEDYIC